MPHELYLAQFLDGAHLLAGQPVPRGTGLVKIGISGNIGLMYQTHQAIRRRVQSCREFQ